MFKRDYEPFRQSASTRWCLAGLTRQLHRDERGTISVVSVFVLLMFTMLLGIVVNVARQVDRKVSMQNSADAATYSGTAVLARGMNAVAYTNHLLCDVFAVTAYLREAQGRNAESVIPDILTAWEFVGDEFTVAEFEKFQRMGTAIRARVAEEREAVTAFGEMSAAAAELVLPVFEYILRDRLIPQFQRQIVRTTPELAQMATREIALRHGHRGATNGSSAGSANDDTDPQSGLLWHVPPGLNESTASTGNERTSGQSGNVFPVGQPDEADPNLRTLPIIDPDPEQSDVWQVPLAHHPWTNRASLEEDVYRQLSNVRQPFAPYLLAALQDRRRYAERYLSIWNRDKLRLFDREGEMSQFSRYWRIATCQHLHQLLYEEYPLTNLPMVIRYPANTEQFASGFDREASPELLNHYLDTNTQLVGVVYRNHLDELLPGLFSNPLTDTTDAMTFSQAMFFLPMPRFEPFPPGCGGSDEGLGGTFGYQAPVQPRPAFPLPPSDDTPWRLERWPIEWGLFSQNWSVKLVPSTTTYLPAILQADPSLGGVTSRIPDLGDLSTDQLKQINTH